jgi:hypothetical protein
MIEGDFLLRFLKIYQFIIANNSQIKILLLEFIIKRKNKFYRPRLKRKRARFADSKLGFYYLITCGIHLINLLLSVKLNSNQLLGFCVNIVAYSTGLVS